MTNILVSCVSLLADGVFHRDSGEARGALFNGDLRMKELMRALMVGLVFLTAMCGTLQADDFTLTGTQSKDVTSSYDEGILQDSSAASILSGGSVTYLRAYNTSTVTILGGSVTNLTATGYSTTTISGGSLDSLLAAYWSSVTFDGYDFTLGEGLSLDSDGRTILGTGLLSGKWYDSSDVWTTDIWYHDPNATVMIPEPATMAMLALGGLAATRRRK